MADVTVVTSALRAEAAKWRRLSSQLEPVKSSVDNLGLSEWSFFIGDLNAGVHSQAYTSFQTFMSTVLAGGVTEFGQTATVLTRIADEYDLVDEVAELDLDKFYRA